MEEPFRIIGTFDCQKAFDAIHAHASSKGFRVEYIVLGKIEVSPGGDHQITNLRQEHGKLPGSVGRNMITQLKGEAIYVTTEQERSRTMLFETAPDRHKPCTLGTIEQFREDSWSLLCRDKGLNGAARLLLRSAPLL